ncbi:hypothetical protein PAESOLCIP111_04632 [Paenibacillus solanacearum]|uniref:Uncharacterized protein n=1 Tax=Paenibacillus solanacearum TaxID=2048548 RepID=A0A916NR16_9BACL|nr:hypothetical protein [Paenibacillus solanacearum]CAG7644137.1 hypothetical protein PAESOLCIP111_04632 [Paenibacillus solanacearum]
MNMKSWSKKWLMTASVALAVSTLLIQPPQTARATTGGEPKIAQAANLLALDDQGNVWIPAMHTITVKDNFYSKPMVKAKDLDRYVSISSSNMQFGLKADGTVWTIEEDTSDEERMNISQQVPSMREEQFPVLKHIEHIVKAEELGAMIGIALDATGKVWTFGAIPRWLRDSPTFNFNPETSVVNGIDHVKDFAFGSKGITFLKDDGTVWYIDTGNRGGVDNIDIFNNIRTAPAVQIKELHDIVQIRRDSALSKDGSFWIWGYGKLANGKDYDHWRNPQSAEPAKVEKITDIVDWGNTGDHALFVKKDGTVWQWGSFVTKVEALGKQPPTEWREFSRVAGLTDVVSVTTNDSYSVGADYGSLESAIKKDGTLWRWGINPSLQIDPTPMQVEFRK